MIWLHVLCIYFGWGKVNRQLQNFAELLWILVSHVSGARALVFMSHDMSRDETDPPVDLSHYIAISWPLIRSGLLPLHKSHKFTAKWWALKFRSKIAFYIALYATYQEFNVRMCWCCCGCWFFISCDVARGTSKSSKLNLQVCSEAVIVASVGPARC